MLFLEEIKPFDINGHYSDESQLLDGLLWISLELNNQFYRMSLAMQRCDVWINMHHFRSFDFFFQAVYQVPACQHVTWWHLAYWEKLIKENDWLLLKRELFRHESDSFFSCVSDTLIGSLMKDDRSSVAVVFLRWVLS